MIKLIALFFISITRIIRGFFVRVLIRKIEDLAIKAIEVRLHICFYTCIAIIKDNEQINNLVQYIYKFVDNFLSDLIIYTIYRKYKEY